MNQLPSAEDELRLLARKWVLPVLIALDQGSVRPVELSSAIMGISEKALHETLRHLNGHGLISRHRIDTAPPATEYHLTESGRSALRFAKLLARINQADEAQRDTGDTRPHSSYRADMSDSAPSPPPSPGIDPNTPSTARMYDYLLGGKENFTADRDAAEQLMATFPGIRNSARANRAFMIRAVRYLARAGLRQFIDLGTGIPTSPNVHEVAREHEPAARVVYVDNDPVVVAHNRALRETQDGIISIDTDIRDTDGIRNHLQVRDLIDFNEPIAVLVISMLHFFENDDASRIIAGVRTWMAPGSYLALSTGWREGMQDNEQVEIDRIYAQTGARAINRSREEIAAYFTDLELIPPGLVPINRWHANDPDLHNSLLGGIAYLTGDRHQT